MNKLRPITRKDHQQFCAIEGWELVQSARGKAVGHHLTYTFTHPDGRILRTRISRPIKPEPYGKTMAAHILRDQLEVRDKEFWACVNDKIKPNRDVISTAVEVIPASMLLMLKNELHMSEPELKGLRRDEAIQLVTEYWATK